MTETKIQWTDATINPIRFGAGHYCQKISPGCANCYASRMQPRFGNPPFGGAGGSAPHRTDEQRAGGLWLDTARLEKVLRRRKPARIFWLDMSDLFGEWVPDEWIDQCFAVMAATHWHTHQVLTKRADRARDYLTADGRPMRLAAALAHLGSVIEAERIPGDWSLWAPTITALRNQEPRVWPLRNVWLGVSVENDNYRWRIAELMRTPAAVRFVSAEPLLGPLQLAGVWPWKESGMATEREVDPFAGTIAIPDCDFAAGPIHWVIAGGESGPGARPCNVAWLRAILAQCRSAGVPCFVKQLGSVPILQTVPDHLTGPAVMDAERTIAAEWPNGTRFGNRTGTPALNGRQVLLRDRKGGDPEEWPDDLRVRQWPAQGATA